MMSVEGSDLGQVDRWAWEWWTIISLAVAAACFGAYGLWIYDLCNGDSPDFWSVGYHTLQLFVLHAPHLDHHVPWQHNLGRWLAAVVFFWTLVRGLLAVFRSQVRLFMARMRRGHVIICGLGRLGMHLAQEFRRGGWSVVAIEANGQAGRIATAQDAGVSVIAGDACNHNTLSRAAIGKASKVIAVCDDEQKNVAIAALAGRMVGGRRSSAKHDLECWMFIPDPRLRRTFQQDRLFPHTGEHYSVNVRGLDFFELAARQILRKAQLDSERIKPGDPTVVHLVIVGFGSMGRYLALQSARIGHFANFQKLRVTVLERKGSSRPADFCDRHKRFEEVCDFTFAPVDMPEGQFDPRAVIHALPRRDEPKQLVTVAVCWDSSQKPVGAGADFFQGLETDDASNLSVGVELAREPGRPQVLVFQTRKTGFAALFPAEGRGDLIGPRVHAFGTLEDTCSMEALLHEREDAIAKALHQDWYDGQLREGQKPGDRPALFPWERLPEHFKDSNRRAADHIRVKMRAIGYRVDDWQKDQVSLSSFDDDQVDLLARMEHESWSAEWVLQNYSYKPGERDDVAKTQPYLVPWDQLEPSVQEWDRNQVRAIPKALRLAKYGIYPQVL